MGGDKMDLFGSRLKKLRLERGMTQSEVAAHFNLKENTYRNYENNQRDPGSILTIAFAKFFGVTVDYLCGLDTSENNKKDSPNEWESLKEHIDMLSTESLETLEQFIDFLLWKEDH